MQTLTIISDHGPFCVDIDPVQFAVIEPNSLDARIGKEVVDNHLDIDDYFGIEYPKNGIRLDSSQYQYVQFLIERKQIQYAFLQIDDAHRNIIYQGFLVPQLIQKNTDASQTLHPLHYVFFEMYDNLQTAIFEYQNQIMNGT